MITLRKLLQEHESNAYRRMIASAYSQPQDIWYTTADLISLISHNLDGNQQKYLGTKFAYYAKKNSHKFEIMLTKGNNKYRTRGKDE